MDNKSHPKSPPKYGKTSSYNGISSNVKGMMKVEHKDRPTDKPKVTARAVAKENKKPQDFKFHTEQRAVKRAMFNYSVSTKLFLMDVKNKHVKRLEKIIEEEEVRSLRKEMVPKAQLMPFFDKPFFPQRSNRPLTIPREPSFRNVNSTCWSCLSDHHEFYHFQHIC